jgi:hypothetical protein
MATYTGKTRESKKQGVVSSSLKPQSNTNAVFPFVDNRQETTAAGQLQQVANNSPQVTQLKAYQEMADRSASPKVQPNKTTLQGNFEPGQKNENMTGLPDGLKTGIENLSGISLDDVRVHYNSGKPGQLHALAYAEGTDIHIAPGQEKHLPHEAWHVVQQKQGRVQPTMELNENVLVNDDKGLEQEAEVMGNKSLQPSGNPYQGQAPVAVNTGTEVVQCKKLSQWSENMTEEDMNLMYKKFFNRSKQE